MLMVTEMSKPFEHVPRLNQASGGRRAVILKEDRVFPKLHLTGSSVSTGNLWYLDYGTSNHMTGDLGKFKELNRGITGKVRFRDVSAVEIMGKGSVLFHCRNSNQWLLHEVYYVPKLKSNLVSLGQLTEGGHRVVLDDDFLEVQRSENRLYKNRASVG